MPDHKNWRFRFKCLKTAPISLLTNVNNADPSENAKYANISNRCSCEFLVRSQVFQNALREDLTFWTCSIELIINTVHVEIRTIMHAHSDRVSVYLRQIGFFSIRLNAVVWFTKLRLSSPAFCTLVSRRGKIWNKTQRNSVWTIWISFQKRRHQIGIYSFGITSLTTSTWRKFDKNLLKFQPGTWGKGLS